MTSHSDGFSNAEKAKAARREAHFRRIVYPRRIAGGAMTKAEADREIALMESIATDYDRLNEADREAAAPRLL